MLLLLGLQVISVVAAQQAVILQAPANVTAALGDDPVVFTCHIQGESLFWRIDGSLYNYATALEFRDRGIVAASQTVPSNQRHETVTMSVNAVNNNTAVVCQGSVFNQPSTFTEPVFLTVADVPLAPSLEISTLDVDTLQVEWTEPFTWAEYPIIGYSMTVRNANDSEDSGSPLISHQLSSDNYTYNLTSQIAPTCTNLTFTLMAMSSVGSSLPGIAFGALPDAPGEFLELPSSEVTFARDQTPLLDINFTFPMLCPYSDATYVLVIVDARGAVVYTNGPLMKHWSVGGTKVTREIRDAGLLYKAEYSVNISVQTLVGQSSTEFIFDTFPEPTLDTTHPYSQRESTPTKEASAAMLTDEPKNTILGGYMVEIISLGVVLGVALVLLTAITLLFATIYGRRRWIKRRRECIGTTEYTHPMVPNPIYEAGVVYDEIPALINLPPIPDRDDSYVTIAATKPNDVLTRSDLNGTVFCDGSKVDDTYTAMQSVGTLKDQLAERGQGPSSEAGGHMAMMYTNTSALSDGGRSTGGMQQGGTPESRPDRTTVETEERYIMVVR